MIPDGDGTGLLNLVVREGFGSIPTSSAQGRLSLIVMGLVSKTMWSATAGERYLNLPQVNNIQNLHFVCRG